MRCLGPGGRGAGNVVLGTGSRAFHQIPEFQTSIVILVRADHAILAREFYSMFFGLPPSFLSQVLLRCGYGGWSADCALSLHLEASF